MRAAIAVAAVGVVVLMQMAGSAGEPTTQSVTTAPSLAPMDSVCALTDAQKTQVANLDAAMMRDVLAYQTANADAIAAARQAIDDAIRLGDAAALARARADYAARRRWATSAGGTTPP